MGTQLQFFEKSLSGGGTRKLDAQKHSSQKSHCSVDKYLIMSLFQLMSETTVNRGGGRVAADKNLIRVPTTVPCTHHYLKSGGYMYPPLFESGGDISPPLCMVTPPMCTVICKMFCYVAVKFETFPISGLKTIDK